MKENDLKTFTKNIIAFKNDLGQEFLGYQKSNMWYVKPYSYENLKEIIIELYYNMHKKHLLDYDGIEEVYKILRSEIINNTKIIDLKKRTYIAEDESEVIYHLGDSDIIIINENGYKRDVQKDIIFDNCPIQDKQVDPVDRSKADFNRIDKYLNISNLTDKLLLKVYLIVSLIENIPRWLLIITGPYGSSKSTLLRIIKALIDPTKTGLKNMSSKVEDLVLSLTQNYLCAFDNLSKISQEISDLLCKYITEAVYGKRMLYTDFKQALFKLFGNLVINGINLVATRPDLLSRSIVINLSPIEEDKRRTERDIWREFEKDKPYILGGMFDILSKAIKLRKSVKLTKNYRMADATKWGIAVAIAMGVSEEEFLQALDINNEEVNLQAVEENSLARTVISYMEGRASVDLEASKLLGELVTEAIKQKIDTKTVYWTKAPNLFSRELKVIQPNLEKLGISVEIGRSHDRRYIKISASAHSSEEFKYELEDSAYFN